MGNAAVLREMGNAALREEDSARARVAWNKQEVSHLQERKMPDKSELSESEWIQITGAVGPFCLQINSSFFKTGQLYNNRMLYRTLSAPTHWLRVFLFFVCL